MFLVRTSHYSFVFSTLLLLTATRVKTPTSSCRRALPHQTPSLALWRWNRTRHAFPRAALRCLFLIGTSCVSTPSLLADIPGNEWAQLHLRGHRAAGDGDGSHGDARDSIPARGALRADQHHGTLPKRKGVGSAEIAPGTSQSLCMEKVKPPENHVSIAQRKGVGIWPTNCFHYLTASEAASLGAVSI
jgi:hypothetical protein